MNVHQYLDELTRNGKGHLTLIDPDEQDPGRAARMAKQAQGSGTNGIMIGGSTGADQTLVDRTLKAVKESCDLPTILFPGGVQGLSPRADAIFYISLLNSSDPYFITGAHAQSSYQVRELDLEAISVGYIVVEPGQTVGRIGKAQLIPRDQPRMGAAYALAGELLGMEYAYLEAGSGASSHVPCDMISETRRRISIPLIVGGGIRSVADAREVIESGADIIVQGTALEEEGEKSQRVARVIDYIRGIKR